MSNLYKLSWAQQTADTASSGLIEALKKIYDYNTEAVSEITGVFLREIQAQLGLMAETLQPYDEEMKEIAQNEGLHMENRMSPYAFFKHLYDVIQNEAYDQLNFEEIEFIPANFEMYLDNTNLLDKVE